MYSDFQLLNKLNDMRSKYLPLMAKRFQIEMVRNILRKACDPLTTVTIFNRVIPQFKQKVIFSDNIGDHSYVFYRFDYFFVI